MRKVAVITGGAGKSASVVDRLGRDDYRIIMLDLNQDGGQSGRQRIRKRGITLNFIAPI